MIVLTRIDGPHVAINCDLIGHIDEVPQTVVTLVDGSSYQVRESMREVVERIKDFRASIVVTAQRLEAEAASGPTLRIISTDDTYDELYGNDG